MSVKLIALEQFEQVKQSFAEFVFQQKLSYAAKKVKGMHCTFTGENSSMFSSFYFLHSSDSFQDQRLVSEIVEPFDDKPVYG